MGNSPGLTADDADLLAALAAGVQRLARGAGQLFAGGELTWPHLSSNGFELVRGQALEEAASGKSRLACHLPRPGVTGTEPRGGVAIPSSV